MGGELEAKESDTKVFKMEMGKRERVAVPVWILKYFFLWMFSMSKVCLHGMLGQGRHTYPMAGPHV
jgi:hypothetical protein